MIETKEICFVMKRTHVEESGAYAGETVLWHRGCLHAAEPPGNLGFRNNTVQMAQQNDVYPALGFDKEKEAKRRCGKDVDKIAEPGRCLPLGAARLRPFGYYRGTANRC